MSERDPALEPFDALIGTWETEAKHRAVDEIVGGSTTSATIGPDQFDGLFELAETPGDWQEDMRVTYRRR